MKGFHLASFAALTMALAGCKSELGQPPAGAGFGEVTAQNHLRQSVSGQEAAFIASARAHFAAEAPAVVFFASNQAAPDGEARAALDAQAAWLKANPALRVRVTGHADLVGGEGYNHGLGLRRARAAALRLVSRGVARERIETVESRGERAPQIVSEAPERLNRRAVTEIAGLAPGFFGDGLTGARARLVYGRYATDTVTAPASANAAGGGVVGAN